MKYRSDDDLRDYQTMFKQQLRATYAWQLTFYESVRTKYYRVLKWTHPDIDDICISRCDSERTKVRCPLSYMSQLLRYIDNGLNSSHQIKDLINHSIEIMDIEISLNVEIMINHLLKLGVIGYQIGKYHGPVRYKLTNVPYGLSIGMHDRQMRKLFNLIDMDDLSYYQCDIDSVEFLLWMISKNENGLNLGDVIDYFKNFDDEVNMDKIYHLLTYSLEHKLIYISI